VINEFCSCNIGLADFMCTMNEIERQVPSQKRRRMAGRNRGEGEAALVLAEDGGAQPADAPPIADSARAPMPAPVATASASAADISQIVLSAGDGNQSVQELALVAAKYKAEKEKVAL
jgi:hypothetical protein